MRITLDFTHLDSLSPVAGQYRYVVALVRGLAELAPDADFVLFGSRAAPVPDLADVFAGGSRWTYRRLEPAQGVASQYRDQVRYAAALGRERAQLHHALHTFLPLLAPCPTASTASPHDIVRDAWSRSRGPRPTTSRDCGAWTRSASTSCRSRPGSRAPRRPRAR